MTENIDPLDGLFSELLKKMYYPNSTCVGY